MGETVPGRIIWAVETLAVEASDRVLEIGGGPQVRRLDRLCASGSRTDAPHRPVHNGRRADATPQPRARLLRATRLRAERALDAAKRVAAALRENGFAEPEILTPAPDLVGCISHPI